MQTLHVRGVPDELMLDIKDLAQDERRSLSAEVIYLLTRSVKLERQRKQQKKLLADIKLHRFTPPHDAPDPVAMLQVDRER